MCGVAGIVNVNGSAKLNSDVLTRMLSAIKHRGPDESGIFTDGKASIGNVRLSIIDLSTGQQPMCNLKGNLWIVFNGEIFNYLELKDELFALGHRFRTTSDTEVLLHLYEEFGSNCLSKLNGQFVFAIWNTQTQSLFIARDRVGIRPLYYRFFEGDFIFASEIKGINEFPGIVPEINFKAISQLFTFWTPLPGHSPFKDVFELEPGHFLTLEGAKLTIKKYWELTFANHNRYHTTSFNQAQEELYHLLLDAVKLRLRSDVPVAAYLSGGLDSSIITSFIKELSPSHLQTFSIGFTDNDYDESSYQKEVSSFLNTQHTNFFCSAADVAEAFPKVVWYSESPLFRTAPAPMFMLSKKVRESNIKVVVTGEGADEILAGYDIFREAEIRRFWARYPNSRYRPLLLKRLYNYIPQISSMNARMLQFVFGYKLTDTGNPFYAFLQRWNNGSFMRQYFSNSLKETIKNFDPIEEMERMLPKDYYRWDTLSQAQWVESKLLMSNYLLSSQGDRMGMANSIEGRYPFLDYRVIEYTSQLPPDFKLKGINEKYILKKMMKDKLPESILKRSKQAYRAPITSAFFSDNPPEYVNYYLSPEKIKKFDLFNSELVSQLVNKIKSGRPISENDAMAVTAVLSTQLFYAMYIEKSFEVIQPLTLLAPVITDKRKFSTTTI